ncbi:hypothetical protein E2C01_039908 [Portunus trituberculatus]|uniref:Uncharacterized protein n=1 Tax=Portunus trituberculatus TaxID=210409 RepID=A0A5B7FL10_PORTR|nr:hypothetical protein [Portunus trituberculatus]
MKAGQGRMRLEEEHNGGRERAWLATPQPCLPWRMQRVGGNGVVAESPCPFLPPPLKAYQRRHERNSA